MAVELHRRPRSVSRCAPALLRRKLRSLNSRCPHAVSPDDMKPEKKSSSKKRATSSASKPSREKSIPRPRSRRAAGSKAAKSALEIGSAKSGKSPARGSTPTAGSAGGQSAVKVPPIPLEGDEPTAPKISGPGKRYTLGPTPTREHAGAAGELGELPEAYGTKRLLLAARDPHWL